MRDWFTKDMGWKIFSVFLALVLWLTVHKTFEGPDAATTKSRENIYGNLPVSVVSASSDVHGFHVLPATVSVTVSGPPDAMAVLQANEIRATVDLTGVGTGKDLLRKVEVSTPRRVTLVDIEPPRVSVIVPPLNNNNP